MSFSTTRTSRSSVKGTRGRTRRSTARGANAGQGDDRLSQRATMIISTPELESEYIETYGNRHAKEAISLRSLTYRLDPGDPPRAIPYSLRDLCVRIAAKHFASHILPLGIDAPAPGEEPSGPKDALGQSGAGYVLDRARVIRRQAPPTRKRTISALAYDEDADSDYQDQSYRGSRGDSDDDAPPTKRANRSSTGTRRSTRLASVTSSRIAVRRNIPRGLLPDEPDELTLSPDERLQRHWRQPATRHFWHFRNSYILRTETGGRLHSDLLQALLRFAPESLTPHVVATYFVMGLEDVFLSISMDAVAKNPTGLPATLLSLILAKGSAVMNPALACAAAGDLEEAQEHLQSIARTSDSHDTSGGLEDLNFGPPQAPGGRQVVSSLCLRGLTRLSTRTLMGFFSQYKAGLHLTSVHLAGCVGVGPAAIKQLVASCGAVLRSVSVENTDVGARGFEALVAGCPRLEVLKASKVEGLGDAYMPALVDRAEGAAHSALTPFEPLAHLTTLKLAYTDVGDYGAARLMRLCTWTLTNLNLANTNVAPKGDFTALGKALGLPGYEASDDKTPVRAKLRKLVLSELHLETESWRTFIHALCAPLEDEDAVASQSFLGILPGAFGPRQHKRAANELGATDRMLDTLVLEGMKAVEKRVDVPGGMSQAALTILIDALQPLLEKRAKRFAPRKGIPLFERIDLSWNRALETETNGGWGTVLQTDPNWRPVQDADQANRRGGRLRGYAWVPEGETGPMHTALGDFIAHVGRFTRNLALDGIALALSDLVFDLPHEKLGPTSTQVLSLAKGNVSDDALMRIARGCQTLTHLTLESSGIEEETAATIVRANPFLEALDLTQCRAIPRSERRSFFNVSRTSTEIIEEIRMILTRGSPKVVD